MNLLPYTQPAESRIGHVHLKVSDLDRSIAFYQKVMGYTLTQRFGTQAAFLSAGGYHHHIGLNTWESRGGAPAPSGHPGLYHAAILVPTREDLAEFLRHTIALGYPLEGAADHGERSLDNALPWTSIDPATFAPVDDLSRLLAVAEFRYQSRKDGD
ncbi:MAG: carboxy terminal-processing peptidase, partial [Schleiferiaceae bacterium]